MSDLRVVATEPCDECEGVGKVPWVHEERPGDEWCLSCDGRGWVPGGREIVLRSLTVADIEELRYEDVVWVEVTE